MNRPRVAGRGPVAVRAVAEEVAMGPAGTPGGTIGGGACGIAAPRGAAVIRGIERRHRP